MGLPSFLAQLHGVTGEKTTHLLTLVAYYAVKSTSFVRIDFSVIFSTFAVNRTLLSACRFDGVVGRLSVDATLLAYLIRPQPLRN